MKYLSYLVFMKLVCELTEPLVIIEGVPLSEQLRATAVRLSDIDRSELSCVHIVCVFTTRPDDGDGIFFRVKGAAVTHFP